MRRFLLVVALLATVNVSQAAPDVFISGFGTYYDGAFWCVGSYNGFPVYHHWSGDFTSSTWIFYPQFGGPTGFWITHDSPDAFDGSGAVAAKPSTDLFSSLPWHAGDPWGSVMTNVYCFAGMSVPLGWTNAVVMVGNNATLTATWWKGFVLGATMALVGLVVKLMRHIARPGPDL